MRNSKFVIPAILALTVAFPVVAQQLPVLPQGSAPAPVSTGNQLLEQARAAEGFPQVQEEQQPVAPMPMQGDGAFGTSVGSDDPAERMNLNDASSYQGQLTENSEKRLQELTGVALSDETTSDLEFMMDSKRRIMLLGLQNEEAELAVSLWGTLYNNEHAQAFRQQERDDAEARKAAEEAANAARIANLAAQNQQATTSQDVVFPVIYEVNGGTAILLVSGGGEVYARAGTDLPGGFKVVSVSAGGVVVEKDGKRTSLGFGTSVGPAPSAAQSAPAFQGTY